MVIASDAMLLLLSTAPRAQNHPDEVWFLDLLDVSAAVNQVKAQTPIPRSAMHRLCVLCPLSSLSEL